MLKGLIVGTIFVYIFSVLITGVSINDMIEKGESGLMIILFALFSQGLFTVCLLLIMNLILAM